MTPSLDRFWGTPAARPFVLLKRSRTLMRALSAVTLLWPLAYLAAGATITVPGWTYPGALAAWALFVLLLNTEGRTAFARAESPEDPEACLAALDTLLHGAGFKTRRRPGALTGTRGAFDLVTGGVESEWRSFPLELEAVARTSGTGTVLRLRVGSRAWLWGVFFGGEVRALLEQTAAAAAALDPGRLAEADRAVAISQQGVLGGGLATRINSALLAGLAAAAALLVAWGAAWYADTGALLRRERLRERLETVRDARTAGPDGPAALARRWGGLRFTAVERGRPATVVEWDARGARVPVTLPAALPPSVTEGLRGPRPFSAADPRSWRALVSPAARADELGLAADERGWSALYALRQTSEGASGWALACPPPAEGAYADAGLLAAAGILVPLILLLASYAFLGIWLARGIAQPLLRVRDALRRMGEGDFSVRLGSKRSDEVGQLARAADWAAEELRRRELVKELFGKYLSRQVADRLLADPGRGFLAGESREVSVLFADVRGFTSFSESRTPEEVVATLNEYFGVVVDVIAAREGVLDKFIGDGLMAVFGAPAAQPDHALRAVWTGLEMQAAVTAMNARRAGRGLPPVNVGIGVNSGRAVSGNLGSLKRMEFTVIGDTVNLASRLEHHALKGQVLIGRSTYEAVKDALRCEKAGDVAIKGKKDPVEIWAVTGPR
ncbi:adenylate/guanylate cyclase domain-containing protein [bacterium]|nr:MAG: adenylate/guanylate cyclase domain-containing protein [bacterium]